MIFCSVFLIAASNTFVRFLHFRFGKDYLEYLNAMNEADQRDTINDADKDTFVHLQSTPWCNLQTPEGRTSSLCQLLALVRWYDSNNGPDQFDEMTVGSIEDEDHESTSSDYMDTGE